MGRRFLEIVHGASMQRIALPEEGERLVGSGPDCDVRIEDPDLPACWFRVRLDLLAVTLLPIGDVELDGRPVSAPCLLVHGDALSRGPVEIVYVETAHRAVRPRPLDSLGLIARLGEEIERCRRHGRSVAVLAADLGAASGDRRAEALRTVDRSVRSVDVVGIDDRGDVVCILPDTDRAAEIPARRVLDTLSRVLPSASVGIACLGADGLTPGDLIGTARRAAAAAGAGCLGTGATLVRRIAAGDEDLVVADPAMDRILGLTERLARSDLPILVVGETGAGKERVARALHAWSPRRDGPFVVIHCAAIPDALFESELFGHERGAFTGAVAAKAGLLESAAGGTVFLDEIGEAPATSQAKLLRFLETRCLTRIGGVRERRVDVRFVAATNRDLAALVREGTFRQDLLYRLAAATIRIPPLRERPRDIPTLAAALLERACVAIGRPGLAFSPGALAALSRHPWPGNVRELKNLVDYCAATVETGPIVPAHLPDLASGDGGPPGRPAEPLGGGPFQPFDARTHRDLKDEVRALEETRIREALDACGGVQVRAAALIGMPLRTLVARLGELGLTSGGRRRGGS